MKAFTLFFLLRSSHIFPCFHGTFTPRFSKTTLFFLRLSKFFFMQNQMNRFKILLSKTFLIRIVKMRNSFFTTPEQLRNIRSFPQSQISIHTSTSDSFKFVWMIFRIWQQCSWSLIKVFQDNEHGQWWQDETFVPNKKIMRWLLYAQNNNENFYETDLNLHF